MERLEPGKRMNIQYIDNAVGPCNKARRDAIRGLDRRGNQDLVITEVGFAFYRDSLIHGGRLSRDYAQRRTNVLFEQYAEGDQNDKRKVIEVIDSTVKGFFRIKDSEPITVFAANS